MIKFCVGHNSKPVYLDSGLFLPLSLTDLKYTHFISMGTSDVHKYTRTIFF